MAVQILCALSALRIVAVDLREDALRLAREAGADVTLNASGLTAAELRAEVGGAGATLVMDCVAMDATLELAAGAVAAGGTLCYMGRGGGTLAVAPGHLPFETIVMIPTWGTPAELLEVVALARAGAIHTEVERYRLDEAIAAYERLRRGEVVGRAVVTPRS